jgi:hypothetical protein
MPERCWMASGRIVTGASDEHEGISNAVESSKSSESHMIVGCGPHKGIALMFR